MPLDAIHDFNRQLLTDLPHQRFEHEPILDYATDERVKARLGWQAEFSKTLFLKFKDGRFALLLTHRDGRLDSKAVKAALGQIHRLLRLVLPFRRLPFFLIFKGSMSMMVE